MLYKTEQAMSLTSVRSSRLQMFFKKSFIKISLISLENTCVLQARPDLSFIQIPKFQGPYSSVSTVFVTSCYSLYFI